MTDDTQIEPRTKVLKNGAVYDLDKKKIVSGAVLTSDKARELVQVRIQKKQDRIMAGAAKVLETIGDWETPSDMDVVEAIGEAVMEKAIDPKAKGQIDAANFILREAGLSVQSSQRANEPTQPGTVNLHVDTLFAIAAELEHRLASAVDRARAVDVEATDTRNE